MASEDFKGFHYVLQKNKYIKDDEYYTYMKDVRQLEGIKHVFENKVIWCPCDTDNSNFTKFFKEHVEYNYKELINTWDDYKKHVDLWEHVDLIVTNPPFSLLREFLEYIMKYKKQFIILVPQHSYGYKIMVDNLDSFKIYGEDVTCFEHNGEEKLVRTMFCTNIKEVDDSNVYNFYKSINDIKKEYDEGTGYLNVNYLRDIPIDYDEPIFVPITIYRFIKNSPFKLLSVNNKVYINGKQKFKRFLIQKK